MAEVTIRDVRKAYDDTDVIHGLNVSIQDGEFVVLVGPSGCGKSTLLRMIAGLEEITGGTIAIGDRVVNNIPPSERDIAMVFQNYALYPHKTVGANMAFSLRMRGMGKAEIAEKVKYAAEILGLTPYLNRYPRALSGGQRQRVAMGRAIVRDPAVFLFDEPLSNLDAKLRVQMRTEIRELHQRLKTTTVYVTHDQIEAMTMADKIVVMENGYIRQTGAPLELYDKPANRFVAAFIGSPSMNLMEGTVHMEGGSAVQIGDTRMPVNISHGIDEGQPVIYGVRPEDLVLGDTGFAATVSVVEPTGSEMHVISKRDGSEIVSVFRDRPPLTSGETIHLSANPDRVHLFDPETGERIGA
ncbi:sn-glycerol-3-phosphate ABC transporter ATP-binding protein UgpC [bacterium]|nr:sn-glycerol-3-phosphate ABC transporter ATP-binding protein UgpC [bacterium]